MSEREPELPDFDESSIAAVNLLQGVVYDDEAKVWNLVLSNQTRLDSYFARIGLRLVVDQAEGFAFLRQLDDHELDHVRGYDQLPKLVHKKRLSYDATLACVLLRDELRKFEEDQVDNTRCVVATHDLLEQWKSFLPGQLDEVKAKNQLVAALKVLADLKYIREFTKDPQEWEIRRILKARMPVATLEKLAEELKAVAEGRSS